MKYLHITKIVEGGGIESSRSARLITKSLLRHVYIKARSQIMSIRLETTKMML